jgi:hypothetical protein
VPADDAASDDAAVDDAAGRELYKVMYSTTESCRG